MSCLKVSTCCGPSGSPNEETKKRRCRGTKARFKKVWTGVKKCTYIVTNGFLPLADVTSDYLTYLSLVESGHELFALSNLLVMFLPFFFKLSLFLVDLVTKGRPSIEHFTGLLLHLPFVSPIVHVFLGMRLLFFDHTDAAQSARIEQIQKVLNLQKPIIQITSFISFQVAALGSLYESFLESGPQLHLQVFPHVH